MKMIQEEERIPSFAINQIYEMSICIRGSIFGLIWGEGVRKIGLFLPKTYSILTFSLKKSLIGTYKIYVKYQRRVSWNICASLCAITKLWRDNEFDFRASFDIRQGNLPALDQVIE